MTANQELYAKALEIAVLILGRQCLEALMTNSEFSKRIFFHNKLAKENGLLSRRRYLLLNRGI
jgi:hypothetical protein